MRAVRVIALAPFVPTLPLGRGLLHPLFARPVRAAALLLASLLVTPLPGRMSLLLISVGSLLASPPALLGPVLTLVLLVLLATPVVASLLCVSFSGPLDALILFGSLPVLVAPLLAARVPPITLLLTPLPASLRLLLPELPRPLLAELFGLPVLTLLVAVLALLAAVVLRLAAVALGLAAVSTPLSGLQLPVGRPLAPGLLALGVLSLRRPVRLASLLPVVRWVSVHGDHWVRASAAAGRDGASTLAETSRGRRIVTRALARGTFAER